MDAPYHVTNALLHKDLDIQMISDTVTEEDKNFHQRLTYDMNLLVQTVIGTTILYINKSLRRFLSGAHETYLELNGEYEHIFLF